ncbi:MAG: hypothetical protein LIR50_12220, partial [Bacillota bacterium]|nr:hypothetical protein [Bacillota bacterium]
GELVKQAKESNQKRLKLKAKGKKTAEDLAEIADINKQIKSIREQIASIISKHKQDKEQLKKFKADYRKQLNDEMGLGRLIQQMREDEKKYAKDFKEDIDNLNYKKAGEDFSKIYEKKTEIVAKLRERSGRLKILKDSISYDLSKK